MPKFWNRRKSGDLFPAWATISAIKDSNGKTVNYMSVMTDITQRKTFEKKLQHLALHDGLTGLLNRTAFGDRLIHAIKTARRHKADAIVLFMDLDYFKEVNDTLGHHVGDELLKHVVVRLGSCLREEDTLARFGGDEFVIILNGIRCGEDVTNMAKKLLKSSASHSLFLIKSARWELRLGVVVFQQIAVILIS